MGWMWASKLQSPPQTPPPQPSQSSKAPLAAAPSETTTTDPEIAKFFALFQEGSSAKSTPAPNPLPTAAHDTPSQQPEQAQQQESTSWFSFTFPREPKSVSTPSDPQTMSSSSSSSSSNTSSHQSSKTSSSYATSSSADPSSSNPPPLPTSTYDDDSVEDPSALSPSEASLARDMTCRTAFDYAYHCQSIGGQWNAVYRHGTLQDCSERWWDFWFCMRMRGLKGKMREEGIRQYYREKEEQKYKGQKSSEDVWQPRKHVVQDGAFLTHELPKVELSDAEWNMMEIEERKKLREKLGLGPETGTHEMAVKKDS
ncbi:hypothetical protein MKZ38_000532 [Zalerion maritima]|uniref:Early meiotic induction protein 1 n=1 Tax=Zalerion maritima TaxID=339359 RepID=A0AAD5RSS2_9PEZI|nr:hypothetical protein MKZ38_000532 [Zalerion maritima]